MRPTQGRNTLVLSERSWAETRATCSPGKAHMLVMPSLLSLPFFLPYWPLPQLIKMLTFLASEKQNPALKILHPFLATGLTCLPLSAKSCPHSLIPQAVSVFCLDAPRHHGSADAALLWGWETADTYPWGSLPSPPGHSGPPECALFL